MGVPVAVAMELALAALVAGVVGAKLGLVVLHPTWLGSGGGMARVLASAGVVAAGVAAAALMVVLFARRLGMAPLAAADLLAPSAALGEGLGRLGCLAAGCCYGRPSALPWAIVYSDPDAERLAGTPLGVSLHPTPLYLGLVSLAVAGLLTWLAGRGESDGRIFGGYLLLSGLARLAIDRTRWPVAGAHLSLGLWAVAAAVGTVLVLRARGRAA